MSPIGSADRPVTPVTPVTGPTSAVFAVPELDVSPEATPQEEELARIVSRLYGRLLAFASTIVAADDAPDVVQEALLNFWRRLHIPGGAYVPQQVEGFLFQQVADVANATLRKQLRRQGVMRRVGGAVTEFVATHVSSPFISGVRRWMHPSSRLDAEDISVAISRAVAELPQRARQVFLLSHQQGKTIREAGLSLGTSEVAARVAHFRATQAMRAHLARQGMFPWQEAGRREAPTLHPEERT